MAITITLQPAAQSVAEGQDATFTVTATGTAPLTYKWFKDSIEMVGEVSNTLVITSIDEGDEALYKCEVSDADPSSLMSDEVGLTCETPTVITVHPLSQNVPLGDPCTLTVTFTSDPDKVCTYKWYKDDVELVGEVADSLVIASVSEASEGAYKIEITNDYGVVTSNAATLVCETPTVITVHPASQTVAAGVNVTFGVTFTSDPDYVCTYQWTKDGNPINGATNATLVLSNVSESSEGAYRIEITNDLGTVTSNAANLVVNTPTVITVHPQSDIIFIGGDKTLSVTCTFDPDLPVTYQWYKDNVIMVGETASSLALVNVPESGAGQYHVVITNALGSKVSNKAVLQVLPFGAATIYVDIIVL